MNHLIVGLDPGKMCGYASLFITGDTRGFDSDDWTAGVVATRLEELVRGYRDRRCAVTIAAERFTPGAQSHKQTRQTDALVITGEARDIARRWGAHFLIQGIADAQAVGTPAILRQLGWWAPGYDHRNKAAAQVALAYMRLLPREYERITRLPGL